MSVSSLSSALFSHQYYSVIIIICVIIIISIFQSSLLSVSSISSALFSHHYYLCHYYHQHYSVIIIICVIIIIIIIQSSLSCSSLSVSKFPSTIICYHDSLTYCPTMSPYCTAVILCFQFHCYHLSCNSVPRIFANVKFFLILEQNFNFILIFTRCLVCNGFIKWHKPLLFSLKRTTREVVQLCLRGSATSCR